jgi:hypothetical protein
MGSTRRVAVSPSFCLAIVVLLSLLSCSSSDDASPTGEQTPRATDTPAVGLAAGCEDGEDGEDGTRYFGFADPRWEFREAVDYPDDRGPLNPAEATLDWYAEHERLTPTADQQSVEGVSLRISGHGAGLDEQRVELAGIDLSEEQIAGVRALAGAGSDGRPTVVSMAVDYDYTLVLLSYGADLDELRQIAAAVEPVCEQQWTDAGGQVLDCLPTEASCGQEP